MTDSEASNSPVPIHPVGDGFTSFGNLDHSASFASTASDSGTPQAARRNLDTEGDGNYDAGVETDDEADSEDDSGFVFGHPANTAREDFAAKASVSRKKYSWLDEPITSLESAGTRGDLYTFLCGDVCLMHRCVLVGHLLEIQASLVTNGTCFGVCNSEDVFILCTGIGRARLSPALTFCKVTRTADHVRTFRTIARFVLEVLTEVRVFERSASEIDPEADDSRRVIRTNPSDGRPARVTVFECVDAGVLTRLAHNGFRNLGWPEFRSLELLIARCILVITQPEFYASSTRWWHTPSTIAASSGDESVAPTDITIEKVVGSDDNPSGDGDDGSPAAPQETSVSQEMATARAESAAVSEEAAGAAESAASPVETAATLPAESSRPTPTYPTTPTSPVPPASGTASVDNNEFPSATSSGTHAVGDNGVDGVDAVDRGEEAGHPASGSGDGNNTPAATVDRDPLLVTLLEIQKKFENHIVRVVHRLLELGKRMAIGQCMETGERVYDSTGAATDVMSVLVPCSGCDEGRSYCLACGVEFSDGVAHVESAHRWVVQSGGGDFEQLRSTMLSEMETRVWSSIPSLKHLLTTEVSGMLDDTKRVLDEMDSDEEFSDSEDEVDEGDDGGTGEDGEAETEQEKEDRLAAEQRARVQAMRQEQQQRKLRPTKLSDDQLAARSKVVRESKELGTGVSGSTRKVLYEKVWFAVKLEHEGNSRSREALVSEANMLSYFDHTNVVRLAELVDIEGHLAEVWLELCDFGTIATYLWRHGNKASFPAVHRLEVACGLARALAYLHSPIHGPNGDCLVVHRDVKTSNSGLCKPYDSTWAPTAKLFDFGAATLIDPKRQRKLFERNQLITYKKGEVATYTRGYAAPELNSGEYGPATDIYAFGVILLELVTSQPAQNEDGSVLLAEEVFSTKQHRNGMVDDKCGWTPGQIKGVYKLALECLDSDWQARPTARQALIQLAALLDDCPPEYEAAAEYLMCSLCGLTHSELRAAPRVCSDCSAHMACEECTLSVWMVENGRTGHGDVDGEVAGSSVADGKRPVGYESISRLEGVEPDCVFGSCRGAYSSPSIAVLKSYALGRMRAFLEHNTLPEEASDADVHAHKEAVVAEALAILSTVPNTTTRASVSMHLQSLIGNVNLSKAFAEESSTEVSQFNDIKATDIVPQGFEPPVGTAYCLFRVQEELVPASWGVKFHISQKDSVRIVVMGGPSRPAEATENPNHPDYRLPGAIMTFEVLGDGDVWEPPIAFAVESSDKQTLPVYTFQMDRFWEEGKPIRMQFQMEGCDVVRAVTMVCKKTVTGKDDQRTQAAISRAHFFRFAQVSVLACVASAVGLRHDFDTMRSQVDLFLNRVASRSLVDQPLGSMWEVGEDIKSQFGDFMERTGQKPRSWGGDWLDKLQFQYAGRCFMSEGWMAELIAVMEACPGPIAAVFDDSKTQCVCLVKFGRNAATGKGEGKGKGACEERGSNYLFFDTIPRNGLRASRGELNRFLTHPNGGSYEQMSPGRAGYCIAAVFRSKITDVNLAVNADNPCLSFMNMRASLRLMKEPSVMEPFAEEDHSTDEFTRTRSNAMSLRRYVGSNRAASPAPAATDAETHPWTPKQLNFRYDVHRDAHLLRGAHFAETIACKIRERLVSLEHPNVWTMESVEVITLRDTNDVVFRVCGNDVVPDNAITIAEALTDVHKPLDFATMVRMTAQATAGLVYLHDRAAECGGPTMTSNTTMYVRQFTSGECLVDKSWLYGEGVAKSSHGVRIADIHVSNGKEVCFKPGYRPPEENYGNHTDVFSLGIIMHEYFASPGVVGDDGGAAMRADYALGMASRNLCYRLNRASNNMEEWLAMVHLPVTGETPSEYILAFLKLAQQCCGGRTQRPSARTVLYRLRQILAAISDESSVARPDSATTDSCFLCLTPASSGEPLLPCSTGEHRLCHLCLEAHVGNVLSATSGAVADAEAAVRFSNSPGVVAAREQHVQAAAQAAALLDELASNRFPCVCGISSETAGGSASGGGSGGSCSFELSQVSLYSSLQARLAIVRYAVACAYRDGTSGSGSGHNTSKSAVANPAGSPAAAAGSPTSTSETGDSAAEQLQATVGNILGGIGGLKPYRLRSEVESADVTPEVLQKTACYAGSVVPSCPTCEEPRYRHTDVIVTTCRCGASYCTVCGAEVAKPTAMAASQGASLEGHAQSMHGDIEISPTELFGVREMEFFRKSVPRGNKLALALMDKVVAWLAYKPGVLTDESVGLQ